MAKETCSVCGKGLNIFNKAARKDDKIMCFQCSDTAKKEERQANKESKKEQKAVEKTEKKEGKNNIEDKLSSIQENISVIENFGTNHNDPEVKEAGEKMKFRTQTLKERLAIEDLSEKEIDEIDEELKRYVKGIKQSTFWDSLSTKFESAGERLEKTGKKLTKAGKHTTAAVWAPPLYIGYRVIKKRKKNKQHASINSPEDHLIAFIRECEQAYKDGKIDEDIMKEYIVDFTNKYYRMDDESLDS